MTASRVSRRLIAPFAILAGGMLALAGVASPAAAHDSLIGSMPEAGASVEQAPEAITLEYSSNLIDAGTVVEVTAADGTVVSTGAPSVVGTEVTQSLEPELAAGEYTVTWRVTSSDGHPIDSETTGPEIPFTVTVGAESPEASATPEPTMTTQTAPDEEDGAEDDGPIEGSAGTEQTPWVAIVGAFVGIGILALAILLITRRLRKTKP